MLAKFITFALLGATLVLASPLEGGVAVDAVEHSSWGEKITGWWKDAKENIEAWEKGPKSIELDFKKVISQVSKGVALAKEKLEELRKKYEEIQQQAKEAIEKEKKVWETRIEEWKKKGGEALENAKKKLEELKNQAETAIQAEQKKWQEKIEEWKKTVKEAIEKAKGSGGQNT